MNNKIKMILIIILIILMIITVINSVLIYKSKNISTESDDFIPLEPETIIPQNSYLFFGKYVNGEVTSKEFYETISNFYKVTFPNYYSIIKNKNILQIREYYSLNKSQIESDIMIKEEDEFVKFCKMISELKQDNLSVESLEIKSGSIIERTNYTISQIDIKYENCKKISMMIKVYKKVQDNRKNIEISMVNN